MKFKYVHTILGNYHYHSLCVLWAYLFEKKTAISFKAHSDSIIHLIFAQNESHVSKLPHVLSPHLFDFVIL